MHIIMNYIIICIQKPYGILAGQCRVGAQILHIKRSCIIYSKIQKKIMIS